MLLLKYIVVCSSIICVVACTNLPTAVEVGEVNTIERTSNNIVTRNRIYTKELDQAILKQEKGSYELLKSQRVTLLSGLDFEYLKHPSLNKGATVGLAKDEEGNTAACFNDAFYREDQIEFCVFDTNDDSVFNYGVYGGVEAAEIFVPYLINESKKHIATRNYRKRELVFNGVKDNKIHFIYREYASEIDAPTNSADFKIAYPRNSKVIFDYKGAKIEVLHANNFEIKFKVLKHFKRM